MGEGMECHQTEGQQDAPKETKVRQRQKNNYIAPAWIELVKQRTCKLHVKESTQILPDAPAGTDKRVPMASDMEIG